MKRFKVQVVACKGSAQMVVSTRVFETENNTLDTIEVGRVRDFEPLDKDSRLEVWVSDFDPITNASDEE